MDHFNIAARTNGKRSVVAVHMYPTQAAMLDAANDFHGTPETPLGTTCLAVVQAFIGFNQPQAIIRLCYQHVGKHILVHELTHAAQIAYIWTAGDIDAKASEHFTHHNEDFAHLVSDLYIALHRELDKRYTIT